MAMYQVLCTFGSNSIPVLDEICGNFRFSIRWDPITFIVWENFPPTVREIGKVSPSKPLTTAAPSPTATRIEPASDLSLTHLKTPKYPSGPATFTSRAPLSLLFVSFHAGLLY